MRVHSRSHVRLRHPGLEASQDFRRGLHVVRRRQLAALKKKRKNYDKTKNATLGVTHARHAMLCLCVCAWELTLRLKREALGAKRYSARCPRNERPDNGVARVSLMV